jgi:hypothetical protein
MTPLHRLDHELCHHVDDVTRMTPLHRGANGCISMARGSC